MSQYAIKTAKAYCIGHDVHAKLTPNDLGIWKVPGSHMSFIWMYTHTDTPVLKYLNAIITVFKWIVY